MTDKKSNTSGGYILLYTILAASLFAVLATGVLVSTLRELELSDQSIEAAKARWAAEAGVECIHFWDRDGDFSALDTTVDGFVDMSCVTETGSVDVFRKDFAGTSECEEWDHEILINPIFAGGTSCAEVFIDVIPLEDYPVACKVRIASRGFNDCSTREVERIVWTDEMGS